MKPVIFFFKFNFVIAHHVNTFILLVNSFPQNLVIKLIFILHRLGAKIKYSVIMYKKWEKIIATKDCSKLVDQTLHFTTAITPKLQRDRNPSSPLGDALVERQCQLHACPDACTHTGVSEGNVPSEKLQILYFWNWNRALWGYKRKLRSGNE